MGTVLPKVSLEGYIYIYSKDSATVLLKIFWYWLRDISHIRTKSYFFRIVFYVT